MKNLFIYIMAEPKTNLLFALIVVIIFVIVVLNQNERGIVTGIIVALIYIAFIQYKAEKFTLADPRPTERSRLDLAQSTEIPTDEETFCKGKNGYQGSVDCAEDMEQPIYDNDVDSRQAVQGLNRNDYSRAVTGIMDRKNEMNKYLEEEVRDASNERWYEQY
jgi:hypothetical protein